MPPVRVEIYLAASELSAVDGNVDLRDWLYDCVTACEHGGSYWATLLKSSVQAVTERGQAVATLQSWSCRPLSTGEALEEGGLAP